MWGMALWVDVIIVAATDDVTSEFVLSPSLPLSLFLSFIVLMLVIYELLQPRPKYDKKLHENLTKLCLENVKTVEKL